MITETLQAVGGWELTLNPDTPSYMLDELDLDTSGFGMVVITPGWLGPPEGLSQFNLLDLSLYTGIMRRGPYSGMISGPGPASLMGDEQGLGDRRWNFNALLGEFSLFIAEIETQWNTHYGEDPPYREWLATDTITLARDIDQDEGTLRDVLTTVVTDYTGTAGVEWKVTPDMRMRAGFVDTLYGADVKAIFSDEVLSWDPEVVAVEATIEADQHFEDYVYRLRAWNDAGSSGLYTGVPEFHDVNGRPLNLTLDQPVGSMPAGSLAGYASRLATDRQSAKWQINVSSPEWCITDSVPVGSKVGVWSPSKGLSDTSDRIPYVGGISSPVLTRLVGCSWPVEAGMGVYLLKRDLDGMQASSEIVDLTQWIQPEPRGATLTVGSPFDTLNKYILGPSALSS